MKIALVHDQLQEFGGAERVLVALKEIFPEADVFTSFYTPSRLGVHAKLIKTWNIKTSWADKVWLIKRFYSPLRFITPLIWESFDFKGYDLVISSSGGYMCKGIITRPETKHICYLHHQPRYLYYYETAIEWQKYWPIKIYGHLINHKLRMWDFLSSARIDFFLANSEETKRRIAKLYRRDSKVIYPPVNIPEKLSVSAEHKPQNYYLTVSRLARAKHVDVLIRAANKKKFNLKIVGEGRDKDYLKSISGPTVEILSSVSDEMLPELYKNAKAFLFASVDDEFGIAPVEAMGHGLPVIAYASGGVPETVIDGERGFLYHTLHEDSLIEKIEKMEQLSEKEYMNLRLTCREAAEKYSFDIFKQNILNVVEV